MAALFKEVVDLGQPHFANMPNIADLPIVFWPTETHEETQLVSGGTHSMESRMMLFAEHLGTHLDAPRHCDPKGLTVDKVPLEQLVLPGHLLDFRHKKAKEPITIDDFQAAEAKTDRNIGPGTAIMCWTGADKYWGEPGFKTERPYVPEDSAQWLVDRDITLFCTDLIGMDEPGAWKWPTHHIWLENGVCMVQQMANFENLQGKEYYVVVAPLKLLGGTGCPVRPIALVV